MNEYIKRGAWVVISLLGCLAIAQPLQAASFDCAKAQSKVEHLICDNPKFSELDSKLGQVYQDVLGKANEEQKQRVIAEQKHWLKFTRNVCTKEPCFKHAYWSRLAELETFFKPQWPSYKKEADKAESIKQVLATATLYDSGHFDPAFCHQLFDDLKQMKDIHFVEPIVQAQSYEDAALDPWKGKSKNGLPLNAEVHCEPRLADSDSDGTLGICQASYGLPPFKIFELPPAQPSGEKRYFIYYDGGYGPMNIDRYKPSISGYGSFIKQINVANDDGAFAPASGGQPSYNSIIEYQRQYYFLTLTTSSTGSTWLRVESVKPNRSEDKIVCSWSPVKPDETSAPAKPKPRKKAKRKPTTTDEGSK